MLYAIICIDKPGAIETRKANRDAHLAHIRSTGGRISQAGPFLDADGQMCGSLLVMEAADRAEVEAWCAADPYATAGLFESVEIRAWNRVIG
ncbi:YciI family protein [Paralimibaculum aggregatum]|uniref:YciI family protein n=1 Tax=Paralimibaculum aggregatum TaxID=3036245 RepID=A0ABQ6LHE4_9RHOB|nr:YciI family protein [Limibaculum sp. NKW23]GMG82710.1 YciI family protein [Limibaculum sp. NKW23]